MLSAVLSNCDGCLADLRSDESCVMGIAGWNSARRLRSPRPKVATVPPGTGHQRQRPNATSVAAWAPRRILANVGDKNLSSERNFQLTVHSYRNCLPKSNADKK